MEIRKEGKTAASRTHAAVFYFLFSIFFLGGCGTPGDPVPPRAILPATVTDLTARQQGAAVVLTLTLPTKSVEGTTLEEPPQVEVFRSYITPAATPPTGDAPPAPTTIAYTVPHAVVSTYVQPDGRFVFTDPVKPDQMAAHGAQLWVYAVRTRVSKRRASDASNVVALRVLPVPQSVANLTANVTEQAIELSWSPPPSAAPGAAAIVGYRVYRSTLAPGAPETLPVLLAPTAGASYRDTQFEFDRTYIYTVVSVAQHETASVESAPSAPLQITPRDTFPPVAPANLVIVLVPATADAPAQLDLSWGLSAESDLTGYNLYRSEQEGTLGTRLNAELLPSPAFRDISVTPGRRYFYRVTAVDRASNESLPSAAASEAVPAGSL